MRTGPLLTIGLVLLAGCTRAEEAPALPENPVVQAAPGTLPPEVDTTPEGAPARPGDPAEQVQETIAAAESERWCEELPPLLHSSTRPVTEPIHPGEATQPGECERLERVRDALVGRETGEVQDGTTVALVQTTRDGEELTVVLAADSDGEHRVLYSQPGRAEALPAESPSRDGLRRIAVEWLDATAREECEELEELASGREDLGIAIGNPSAEELCERVERSSLGTALTPEKQAATVEVLLETNLGAFYGTEVDGTYHTILVDQKAGARPGRYGVVGWTSAPAEETSAKENGG